MKRLLVSFLAVLVLAWPALAEQHLEPGRAQTGKTADFTVATGSVYLGGWSVRESAGSAAVATLIIRDAADTDTGTGGVQCNASGGATQVGGNALVYIELAGDQSVGESYQYGISAPLGLCVDVIAGTVDFTAYLLR